MPVEKQRGLADFDRFGIDFPDEAGVDMKVVLVASTFLIDYLYFEGDNGDSDDDWGHQRFNQKFPISWNEILMLKCIEIKNKTSLLLEKI